MTLPGIRGIIAIQLILAVGQILNVSFDQIFILLTDLTLEVGETIDYYIYRIGLGSSNNFSLDVYKRQIFNYGKLPFPIC